MLTTNQVELLEKSAVKLRITIPETEVKKEFDDLVKGYCKTVQLKGFRKGKVPADVLMRKFGDDIKKEAVQKIIEKSLKETLEKCEYKPLPYCKPEINDGENLKLELDKDFSFEISYDIYPKVELANYTGLEVEEPQVKISEDDLQDELKKLQEQNAMVVEKKVAIVAKDDIVTMDYVELDDDGNEKTETRRESFTFTVGSGYNLYEIDDQVTGMKKEEEKVIEKEFPQDYKYDTLAGRRIQLKIKVTNIKIKDLPELDDELAQDISEKYQTLEDLKTDLRTKLKEALEEKIRETEIKQFIKQLVEATPIILPESMVQQELEMKWRTLLYRFGANEKMLLQELQNQQKTKEGMLNDWRAAAEESIKSSIVVEELAARENIQVTPEEADAEIQKLADAQQLSLDDMKNKLNANKMLDSVNLNIRNQKLFTQLLKSIKLKKGKKYKYPEFMQDNAIEG